jgi:hypothetical protein
MILLLINVILTLTLQFTTTTALPIASAATNPQTTVFSTTSPPLWLHSATITLICYDVIAVGAFIWLWVCGHLAWGKRVEGGREDREAERVQMRRRERGIEGEMRRMGML